MLRSSLLLSAGALVHVRSCVGVVDSSRVRFRLNMHRCAVCLMSKCACRFDRAHGPSAITSIAFDTTQRRLLTGADNGEVKAWNFSSGMCLTDMVSSARRDITGARRARRCSMHAGVHAPGNAAIKACSTLDA